MCQRSFTLGFILVACLCPVMVYGQLASKSGDPVSVVRLTPPSSVTLKPGDDVRIDFRYSVQAQRAFRIFIRPMAGSELAPGYAASGSQLYEPGRGSGSATFTLKSPGRVDRLRLVVAEDGTGRHLHRSYVDVDYRFSAQLQLQPAQIVGTVQLKDQPQVVAAQPEGLPKLHLQLSEKTLEQLGTYQPPYWRPLPETPAPEPPPGGDGIPQCQQLGIEPKPCEEVAGRRLTEDGVIILDCADGSTWRTTPTGDVFTAPDGRSCREFVMALRMGTALPPAEPPDGVSAAQWAEQLNAWLDGSVANNLLFRIQLLLGDEYFANYQQLEADATTNLYQRIDYRLAFLDKLREGQ